MHRFPIFSNVVWSNMAAVGGMKGGHILWLIGNTSHYETCDPQGTCKQMLMLICPRNIYKRQEYFHKSFVPAFAYCQTWSDDFLGIFLLYSTSFSFSIVCPNKILTALSQKTVSCCCCCFLRLKQQKITSRRVNAHW